MNVDVHWHHLPAALVEAILSGACPLGGSIVERAGAPAFRLPTGFVQDLPATLTDPALLVPALDAAGLDVATPSLPPPLMHHDAPVDVALAVSRTANDAFAALRTDRLRPLANVPLQDAGLAARELRRAILELGLSGVAISTNVNGRNLGSGEFRPFWREVAELDAFVFVHPAQTPLGARDRLSRPELTNFVAFPLDTAAAVASLMFEGVYRDFPTLKTCFSHGGGAFPYILARWEHGYAARLAGRTDLGSPSSYLDCVYCDSLTHDAAALRYLDGVLDDGHVFLGSDHPFDMGEPEPVAAMLAAGLDPSAAGATAARLIAR